MRPSVPEQGQHAYGETAGGRRERLSDSVIRALLATPLDYESTLRRLARASVPDLADCCVIDTLEDDELRRVAIAHVDPAKERLAWELAERHPMRAADPIGVPRVIRSGGPQIVPELGPEELAAVAEDPEHLRILLDLGLCSTMIVPLRARGRTLGAISFVTSESGRCYGAQDLAEAQDVIDRAATLVDNARLYTNIQRTERELRCSRDKFRVILEGVADGIAVSAPDDGLVYVNDAAARLMGFESGEEVLATPVEEIVARYEITRPDGQPLPMEELPGRIALSGGTPDEQLVRWVLRATGEERWSVVKARPLFDDEGRVRLAVNIFTDVTELKQAERERARLQAEAKFRGIVESAPDALVGIDGDGRIVLLNRKAETLFGYARDELIGQPLQLLWPERFRGHASGFDLYLADPEARDAHELGEVAGLRKDGSEFPAEISVSPIETDDGPIYIASVRDVTERKRTEAHIAHLAFHDRLTGLPNRTMLEQHLDVALGRARRNDQAVALLTIDLDEFKVVNDSLGHLAGDDLLRQVARRLETLTRASDLLARQGGDEFLLLVSDLARGQAGTLAGAVTAIAERIHAALRDPFAVEGHECRLGASVGVSVYPDDAANAAALLRHGDAALYNGKALGRGATAFYAGSEADPLERLSLTTRLRRAVEREEFVLHYQPVVDLRDGTVVGVEALVRWDDPERGLIPPLEFIAAAEGLGLIERLGDWVFAEACRQARAWSRAGARMHMSINLSMRQVWQTDLVERLLACVREVGLEPNQFVIELTESTAMTGSARGEQTMTALADAGFRLAIDDFGTGYSSLARLKGMPVEILKIDRSFIADAHAEDSSAGIVRTIVELARSLDLSPIAEGIETEEQWRALTAHGCRFGQGYLFGRPVPAAEVPLGRVPLPVA